MIRALLFLAAATLASAPLAAQVRPQAMAGGDARFQTVTYAPNQVVLLEGAPGYQITLELSPDERAETIALGDSSAWQVTPNKRGDLLFIKATSGASTNMTVITNVRTYNFDLSAGSPSTMAYTVRFLYPPPATPADEDLADDASEGRYRLGGDRALRPSEISDDGTHTYIRWPRDRALPAVYTVTDGGQEMLVNGMMREDDLFVIDSIQRKLVFRIDDNVATATRQQKKAR